MTSEFRVPSFGSGLCASSSVRDAGRAGRTRNPEPGTRNSASAFTLLEIMIVVAIIAIVMTIGVPFMKNVLEGGKGIGRAVKDIQEACSDARAMAILQQTTTELVIRPGEGTFDVSAASSSRSEDNEIESPDVAGNEWRMKERNVPTGGAGGAGAVELRHKYPIKLPTAIRAEIVFVNGEDWTEAEVARVRFRRNGTSDEMSVVLTSDQNEKRNIRLDVVTGLAEVESDPTKFQHR